ncbi:hypothetical protein BDZ97DRAFT_525196 [Flammula alnicola]|nr:hypothetical protein BDZ97DRAFT_525196 [Flammula alnicola]
MYAISNQGPGPSNRKKGNNNNKLGKNQYKDRPLPDDPHVAKLLEQYHLKGVSDKKQISKLLLEEHGLTLSESSISRRKRKLGLRGSHITTLELSDDLKRQLILDQMAKDPAGKLGPRIVKQAIFEETGIQLTRDYIRAEMRTLDPVAHSARVPAHVRQSSYIQPKMPQVLRYRIP